MALIAVWVGLLGVPLVQGRWLIDRTGTPTVANFLPLWSAGRLALADRPLAAYDWHSLNAVEALVVGPHQPTLSFLYPPTFLLVTAIFGGLPYLWSCFAWLAVTGLAYLGTLRRILPHSSVLLVGLAAPPAFINILETEQGFAVAALTGITLVLLDSRPVLAGMALGLLTMKPQLGLIFPLVLIATGRWTAFVSAAIATLFLAALSAAVFGTGIWPAFLRAGPTTVNGLLGSGTIATWADKQTWYSLARYWGAAPSAAATLHALAAAGIAAVVCWLWRRPVSYNYKAAAAAVGSSLLTPFLMSYDTVVLVIAVAFLVKEDMAHEPRYRDLAAYVFFLFLPLYPMVAHGIMPLVPISDSLLLAWIAGRAAASARLQTA